MKKIIIPFAIFALFIANSLEAAPIKVWHEMHDNAPSAVNAEGILKASPNAIWETLIRFNDFAKFMPRVRESFFITQEGVDALKKTKTRYGITGVVAGAIASEYQRIRINLICHLKSWRVVDYKIKH